MFIAAFFHTRQIKDSKCLLMARQINEMWQIRVMEHPASKSKAIPAHATASMYLEDIMLGERSQACKDKYRMLPLTKYLEQSSSQRKQDGGCQRRGKQEVRGYYLMGSELHFRKLK